MPWRKKNQDKDWMIINCPKEDTFFKIKGIENWIGCQVSGHKGCLAWTDENINSLSYTVSRLLRCSIRFISYKAVRNKVIWWHLRRALKTEKARGVHVFGIGCYRQREQEWKFWGRKVLEKRQGGQCGC